MQMLKRFPELAAKIGQLMDDYIQALRSKDETPGSLLAMTPEAEAAILDKYKSEVVNKQEERERQRVQEKARKEQRKKERNELRDEKKRVEAALGKKISHFDAEDMEDESLPEDKVKKLFIFNFFIFRFNRNFSLRQRCLQLLVVQCQTLWIILFQRSIIVKK